MVAESQAFQLGETLDDIQLPILEGANLIKSFKSFNC